MSKEKEEGVPSKDELLGIIDGEESPEPITADEEQSEPEAEEYSEVEQKAMELGWRS